MPPEEFVRRIQEAGQLGAIYSDVRRSKALIAAVAAATVTDESGAAVDLSDLIGDAGDVDEAPEVPAADAADEGAAGAVSDAQVVSDDDADEDTADAEDTAADETVAVQPEGGKATASSE
jgi:trigger factor